MRQSVEIGTGAAATGATVTPSSEYGHYLATNGTEILTYAEWFQIIGATWVVILILKHIGVFKLIKWIYGKTKKESRNLPDS